MFSLSSGIFHPYYTVQLAPAVAALAGTGGLALWRLGRTHRAMVWALPAAVVVTAGWAVVLLGRTRGYDTWLPPAHRGRRRAGRGRAVGRGPPSPAEPGRGRGRGGRRDPAGRPHRLRRDLVRHAETGSLVSAGPSTGDTGNGPGGGTTSTADAALIAYLEAHRGSATYLVAGTGSQTTASIIIASGQPVITIGGFNGGDPAPTLAEFEHLVATGQVHYVLVGGTGGGFGGGGPGGSGTASAIDSWVTSHGTVVSSSAIGGSTAGTLYRVGT